MSYSHIDYSYQYQLAAQPHPAQPYPHPHSQPSASFANSQRVPEQPPHAAASGAFVASYDSTLRTHGTANNPLIPKRRRRTTPAELNVLESEFRSNPRPDPLERARIATELGMTARAVQVWYQNRRQKEKKEASSFSGGSSTASSIASSGSDPKDLDGVVLSFSSSPLPSPNLPLYPGTGAAVDPFKSLAPSNDLYSSAPHNKENIFPRPAPQPYQTAQPYRYSYPSTTAGAAAGSASSAALSGSSSSDAVPSVYHHRPHNASIIAAKKHVRKRPLGSHAPLARTPSLPHAFEFPPSPPKPVRSVSSGSGRPAVGRKSSLNDVVARQQMSTSAGGELRRTASTGALFAHARGETVAARRRSATPMSAMFSGAGVAEEDALSEVDPICEEDGDVAPLALPAAASGIQAAAPAGPGSLAAMTPASKARAKEDLLRHMESDPPSASSPQPLTRRRMMAHDAALADLPASSDDDEPAAPSAAATRPALPARTVSLSNPSGLGLGLPSGKPAFARASSLSALPASFSSSHPGRSLSISLAPRAPASASASAKPSPSLDTTMERAQAQARAPGTGSEMACAVEALGRKRARIIENGPAAARSLSLGGLGAGAGGRVAGARAQKRRRSSAETALSSAATATTEYDADADESSMSMGDLSFSSTSTASTVDSLVTVADGQLQQGYFALPTATASTDKASATVGQADDERECAELLLGLGGFF
ncbi:hypothetical protein JCM10207_007436 [Rhodosporidiobolus poonsookiae]